MNRHIAIVRQRYNPFGGAERFVERAVAALRARGTSVTIVTRGWPTEAGENVIRCDPFYAGSLWRDLGFARATCATVKREHFDLVQSHERIACCDVFRAGDGVHAQWLAQRSRLLGPIRTLFNSLNPYHRYVLAAERALFASPRLKAVICNSRMVRDEIRTHFGVPTNKLHVVYNGLDTSAFHPGLRAEHRDAVRTRLGIAREAKVVLFVGSGFARKGLKCALQVLARQSPNTHLVVVGTDKNQRRYEALAHGLRISERVHFAGGVQDVRPFFGSAELFLLPTLYDPFPNACLEALASGLPVVTSVKCGAAEIVTARGCGAAHDALNADAFSASVRDMLDPERLPRLSAAARSTAVEFGIDAMIDRLLAIHDHILEQHAGAAAPA